MSKQQRRKGNAKNASSASAHGYLSQGGATLVGLTPEMNIFEVASNNQLHHVSEIDDETRIVMKKLTKKDCQTREKGLKELIELINSEHGSIENSYEHFCGLVPQLSTDGSPTVRMITMKVIGAYLQKLKKAAGKGLKKIIPMVLFAKSDVTNGVAASATSVIRDGFDPEKKAQIIQLFGPLTFEIATNIILEKNDLSAPIEYDSSEDKEARRTRLETQSLNVFLNYIREHGDDDSWEEHARKIFDTPEYIKKVFTGTRESIKVQLLNICYKFRNNVDTILNIPQIVPYIQNTLDAQTFGPECATAWEGLLLLLPNPKMQEKISKGIYPRILNVIRKKGNHWKVLKHYFLSIIVLLLRGNSEEDQKIVTSLLESFVDKLPWPIEASMLAVNSWFHTFSEFVRWIVSNGNLKLEEILIPLTIKMTEQSMIFNTAESTESISGLLQWIIESRTLPTESVCKQIEEKIIEIGKDKSKLLKEALTSSGKHVEFSDLHSRLLSNPELADFHLIKNLANSEQNYFVATVKKLENFGFIEDTDKFDLAQSVDVVHLITRIVNGDRAKSLKIQIKNNYVGRRLLLTSDSEVWERILKNVDVGLFQSMVNFWHEKRNGKAIAEAVSFLRLKGIDLDTNQATDNVDFLISLLQKLEVKENQSTISEEKNELIRKLFTALFDSDDEPTQEHYETMKKYMGTIDPDDTFQKLFYEENEPERILLIAARFDKLIGLCEDSAKEITQKIMLSEEKFNEIEGKVRFLELDVLSDSSKSTWLHDAFSTSLAHLSEEETTTMVKEFGRLALFNVASSHKTPLHDVFGWLLIQVITSVELRYCLKTLDNELKQLKEEIQKRVVETDDVRRVAQRLAPSNFVDKFYEDKEDKKTPLEYMETVFESQSAEDAIPIFQFDQLNTSHWHTNLIFAKKFLRYGSEIFNAENLEFRDFALCGIVSVLDNSTDILADSPHAFEENPRLEALTTIYIQLFLALNNSINTQSEHTIEEWNEFYAPTISTYFIRMFRSIRKDQQPTPFVQSLLKVLLTINSFPTGVPNDDVREFVPELSVFKYSPFEESCISHAFSLFSSSVEHIQLIGYSISKLLMPIMFKTENKKALAPQDDTQVNVSSRPKLSLPVMITKSYPTDHSHPHVGPLLLDLALLPLEFKDSAFTQEQRVAYCDSIDQFFKNALNALMLDQPFEFRQNPIYCRIPRQHEREYYLTPDLSPSPVFFDKFASRLLFKSITLLPAAVRLFYKGMPNQFMSMFQEVVTKYASKLLIEQELLKVSSATFEGEMKVRTVPVTGEIIAEYVIEETKMKLTIELPAEYPLAVPTMKLDKAIVKTDRAKKWLLQLNAYLFHQNGAILEGIEMWKRNVDKGVEGVEDCTICMMTVHQQTHQLPKVRCKQCKNKFHSNCLYKWFESSNQSTCPLCRNNFT